jgi:hypothetical protein
MRSISCCTVGSSRGLIPAKVLGVTQPKISAHHVRDAHARPVYLLDVSRGKASEGECRTRAGELERALTHLEATSALREAPEEARVEERVKTEILICGDKSQYDD